MNAVRQTSALFAGVLALTMAAAWSAAAQVVPAPETLAGQIAAADLPPAPASVFDTPRGYVGNAWLTNHFNARTALFEGYAPMNGGVAFVGDSITEGGDWAGLFPGVEVRNFGISGDRSEGVLVRTRQVIASNPDGIILLIGTNDLSVGETPEAIAANVAKLLDGWKVALPHTRLVVQSVLPRQPEFDGRIRDLNARLKTVAAEHGADYLDIHTAFVVQGDRLDPAVTEDDLHLTFAGYQRWARLIDGCVREGDCE